MVTLTHNSPSDVLQKVWKLLNDDSIHNSNSYVLQTVLFSHSCILKQELLLKLKDLHSDHSCSALAGDTICSLFFPIVVS